jgi:hypothetical protein
MKSKINILVFLFTVLLTVNCFGNDYYFKPWKSRTVLPIEKIYIQIDKTKSEGQVDFFERIFNLIKTNLETHGFSCELICQHSSENYNSENTLILSFNLLKPAYVKLQTFQAQIPFCNRFEIKQTNPKSKNLIETVVVISVDKEEEGIKQFATDFINKILKNIRPTASR